MRKLALELRLQKVIYTMGCLEKFGIFRIRQLRLSLPRQASLECSVLVEAIFRGSLWKQRTKLSIFPEPVIYVNLH